MGNDVMTLYMGCDGVVYRIRDECVIVDRKKPVELSYAAFLQLSAKEAQIGIETLLSPNAIRDGAGYTSRNISVINIPGVGMAWATRISTVLPENVASELNVCDRTLGKDFVFLWPPCKALAAYLTVVEQTRIDNRTRFLSTCDPTPKRLFADWNEVIERASTPVDPATLSVGQRMFAGSFRPMVHLASPRYTMDRYCRDRSREEAFVHDNAPIQLKFSGLKRLRQGKDEFQESPPREERKKVVDFFVQEKKGRRTDTACKDSEASSEDNDMAALFHGMSACERQGGRARRIGNGFHFLHFPVDIQRGIVETLVHASLNNMANQEAVDTIRNARLVSKDFRAAADESLHGFLVDACLHARRFCHTDVATLQLDGLLLKRIWWDNCRLPYIGLLLVSDKKTSPRNAIGTLASIVSGNSHTPYPLSNVVASLDPCNEKRNATMRYMENKIRELQELCTQSTNR